MSRMTDHQNSFLTFFPPAMVMVVVVVLGHQQKMPHNLVGCEIKARHVSQPTLYGRISIKQWVNRPSNGSGLSWQVYFLTMYQGRHT